MRMRQLCAVAASSVLISVSFTALSASAASSPSIDPAFSNIRELATASIEAATASEAARLLVVAATPPPVESLYGVPLRGDVVDTPDNTLYGVPLRGDVVDTPENTLYGVPLRGDTPTPLPGSSPSVIPLRGNVSSSISSSDEAELLAASSQSVADAVLEETLSEDMVEVLPVTTTPTALPFAEFEFSEAGIPLRGTATLTVNGVPLRGNLINASTNEPLTGLALLEVQYAATRDLERVVLSQLASAVDGVTEAGFSTPEVVASWMEASLPRRVAVFSALEYFGAPYVAAASGPDAFDCSGLTLTAWGAAGVDLEHWSVLQQTSVSPVPYELTIPGDLAFFEGGPTAGGVWNIGHVGMVFAPGFMVQSSPSNGVWVYAFAGYREATSFGSPSIDATI